MDLESLSHNASLSSLLGVKGPLRVGHHPNPTSQKAHVVLRRVERSQESNDYVQDVVYFKLFANKKISFQPGKELLLTIASVDDRFEDRIVVFEGNLTGSDNDSDHEGTTQVEEEPQVIEEEEAIPEPVPEPVVPPKMRRQLWTRRVEKVSPVVAKAPVARASVGIQAQPIATSVSVQTDSPPQSLPPVQRYSSTAVQTDIPTLSNYANLHVQTDLIPSSTMASVELDATPHDNPMQFRSPSVSAPLFSAEVPWAREPSKHVSMSPASEDMEMSPVSVKMEEIEEMSPFSVKMEEILPFASFVLPVKEETVEQKVFSVLPPVIDTFDSDHPKERAPNPYGARNSFVSGGFVTDFLTAVALPEKAPQTMETESRSVDDVHVVQSPTALNPFPEKACSDDAIWLRAARKAEGLATANPRSATDAANADRVADGLSSQIQPVQTSSALQRSSLTHFTPAHMGRKFVSGAKTAPQVPSAALPESRSCSSASAVPRKEIKLVNQTKQRALLVDSTYASTSSLPPEPNSKPPAQPTTTPPPEPRALASISSGPASNPLNIRPSELRLARPVITAPTKAKKPVVVGRGWPPRSINDSSTSTSSCISPRRATAPGAALVNYVSPSPPPTFSTPATNTVNKWKRIGDEISVRVPGNNPSSGESPTKVRIPIKTDPELLERMSITGMCHVAVKTAPTLLERMSEGKAGGIVDVEDAPLLPRPFCPQDRPQVLENTSQPNSNKNVTKPRRRRRHKQPQPLGVAEVGSLLPAAHHSLPQKPPPPASGLPPRGIKRERANSPDLWTAPGVVRVQPTTGSQGYSRRPPSPDLWTAPDVVRIRRQPAIEPRSIERPPSPESAVLIQGRSKRWSTINWTHSEMLRGDGDLGIRKIAFNSNGSYIALHCCDHRLRVWDNFTRREIACLLHDSRVIELAWLDGGEAVLTLCEDGVLGKWTWMGANRWEWGRILDVGSAKRADEDIVCLAHARDRIAIALPQIGVKVWAWYKGSWVAQRSIARTHVTALKFIDGGDALIGGTRDGVVWHCAVPNGTMKAYAFLQSSIASIDINASGTHALITQRGGSACQIGLGLFEEKRVGTSYMDSEVREAALGAVFASQGTTVLFGAVDGSLLVWDAHQSEIMYGMEHAEGQLIQAVANCDGAVIGTHGCVLTGTRQGQLIWWPQPPVQAGKPLGASRKRVKVR